MSRNVAGIFQEVRYRAGVHPTRAPALPNTEWRQVMRLAAIRWPRIKIMIMRRECLGIGSILAVSFGARQCSHVNRPQGTAARTE